MDDIFKDPLNDPKTCKHERTAKIQESINGHIMLTKFCRDCALVLDDEEAWNNMMKDIKDNLK